MSAALQDPDLVAFPPSGMEITIDGMGPFAVSELRMPEVPYSETLRADLKLLFPGHLVHEAAKRAGPPTPKVFPPQAAGASLLIDVSVREGRRKLKLFGLDPDGWTVRTLDSAASGKRFDRVVVVLPDQASVDLMDRVQHLRTLVAIGGTLDFI